MRDKKDVIVDDIKYQVYPMSPLKANRVLVQLTKVFGKTIANVIMNFLKGGDESLDKDIKELGKGLGNLEAMAKAFADFAVDVDEDKFEGLLLVLLNKDLITADGKKMLSIDSHFGNHGLLHMYKVCWVVLQANYSDFLEGAAESLG